MIKWTIVVIALVSVFSASSAFASDKNPATRQYLSDVLGDHPVQSDDATACFTTAPTPGGLGTIIAGLTSKGGCNGLVSEDLVEAETPERLLAGQSVVLLRKTNGDRIAVSKN